MDSNDTPAGGPRWEPPYVPPPADAGAPAPAGPPRTPLMKTRLALVAGAVGLVAVGGIGGFVLGQSSSATAGMSSDQGRFGGPPGMTGGGEGFTGQVPGGGEGFSGRLPGGTTP